VVQAVLVGRFVVLHIVNQQIERLRVPTQLQPARTIFEFRCIEPTATVIAHRLHHTLLSRMTFASSNDVPCVKANSVETL